MGFWSTVSWYAVALGMIFVVVAGVALLATIFLAGLYFAWTEQWGKFAAVVFLVWFPGTGAKK